MNCRRHLAFATVLLFSLVLTTSCGSNRKSNPGDTDTGDAGDLSGDTTTDLGDTVDDTSEDVDDTDASDTTDADADQDTGPTCTDNVQNGNETGTDCGGDCPNGCGPGLSCRVGEDCTSLNCVMDRCVAPRCNDMIRNGDESDVDCGGTLCDPCDLGETCVQPTDCIQDAFTTCDMGVCTCAPTVQQATLDPAPIDIIIAVDNSGSMGEEILALQTALNLDLYPALGGASPYIDYRIIMLSDFGPLMLESVCMAMPLGGIPDANMDGLCDVIPAAPINGSRFLHHDIGTGNASHNILCGLIDNLGVADEHGLQSAGYESVLRQEAFKTFLAVTDDGVTCFNQLLATQITDGDSVSGGMAAANTFNAGITMASPTQFGTVADPNYRFYSIVGQAALNPTGMNPDGEIIPGTAALTTSMCPTAADPGTGYQALSRITDGARYPSCASSFTPMFDQIVQDVNNACRYQLPNPGTGQTFDPDKLSIWYTPPGMTQTALVQVPNISSCTANSFYIDNDVVTLCPDVCSVVDLQNAVGVETVYGCDVP